MITLDQLRPGQQAEILSMAPHDAVQIRLMEMGLLPGEVVELVGHAPLGDPFTIRVRGARLALRARDARRIPVRLLDATPVAVGA
jgi:ferrous iron transport protein A